MKKLIIALILFTTTFAANALIEIDFGHTKYIAAVLKVEGKIEVWITPERIGMGSDA